MRTLFIVGAGASADFNLPVGSALQAQVADFLRPNLFEQYFGRDIDFVVDELERRGLNYQDLSATLEWISRTLPLSRSIDNFLETQSEDDDAIAFLGKYAIATIIARGEEASPLYTKTRRDKLNFIQLSDTWLGQLWPLINRGGAAKVDEKGLDEFAFLTFNYDRCIEQFLYHAFSEYYRMDDDDAAGFVSRVKLHHVYGSLGDGLHSGNGIRFGDCILSKQKIDAAKNIKTFSEQIADDDAGKIQTMMNWSERIVFIGFSFMPMNTSLLSQCFQADEESTREIFGTAYQMSYFDTTIAKNWCSKTFRRNLSLFNLIDQKGVRFFKDHQLLFTRS